VVVVAATAVGADVAQIVQVLIGLAFFGILIGLALLAGPIRYAAKEKSQRQSESCGEQTDPPAPQFPGPFFPGG
jgi:hypothetical protein